jgi:hypothetical protein
VPASATTTILPLPAPGTLILAIVAILLGTLMNARWTWLKASNIPPAVSGGLVFACVTAALHSAFALEIEFASATRNVLLLVFFVGLGLAAKFSGLRKGGSGCGVAGDRRDGVARPSACAARRSGASELACSWADSSAGVTDRGGARAVAATCRGVQLGSPPRPGPVAGGLAAGPVAMRLCACAFDWVAAQASRRIGWRLARLRT